MSEPGHPSVYTFDNRARNEAKVQFRSFSALLNKQKENTAVYLAVYSRFQKIREIRFAEFFSAVWRLRERLQKEGGIGRGARVASLLGSQAATFVANAAILSLQAVLVPLDPDSPDEYLNDICRHANAKIILTDSTSKIANDPCPHFLIDKEEIFHDPNAEWPTLPEPDTDPFETPAAIFYTSGTTGSPKGVQISMGNILVNLNATRMAVDLNDTSVLGTALPLFHVNAFNFGFLLPLFLGCKTVYQSPFFYPSFWQITEHEGIEVYSVVPQILRQFVMDPSSDRNTSHLKYFISAAAPLNQETLKSFWDRYRLRILQAYGLSETVNFTLFTPNRLNKDVYEQALLNAEIPSAGAPVWGNDVFLLSDDGKTIEQENQVGELTVRGWNVFQGYLDNPEATANAFRNGYFHSGDLAYFREIGGTRFYFLKGRIKETIKRNGELIYLNEIDTAIKSIGLDNACAVGFTNQYTGEEVGIYLECNSPGADMTDAQILKLAQQKIGLKKAPKVIVRGPEIPKTSTGKLQRQKLLRYFDIYKDRLFSGR